MITHEQEIEQLRARVADLTEDSQNYHRAMQCLSDMKMEHGLCQPRSRKACTNCNAADILEAMQSAYKGPRIAPQQEQEGEGRE